MFAIAIKNYNSINKQYLNLQYKIIQHKFCSDILPDCLAKALSDLERKVRLISGALESTTTRTAGSLDFTTKGGKKQGHAVP